MTACQIRVLTNGYLISYMQGDRLFEYAFIKRDDLLEFIDNVLMEASVQ